MQIKDDGETQPTLTGPDVADIARPFLIGPFCLEVTVQQVRRDVERVIAVSSRFEFPCSEPDRVYRRQFSSYSAARVTAFRLS